MPSFMSNMKYVILVLLIPYTAQEEIFKFCSKRCSPRERRSNRVSIKEGNTQRGLAGGYFEFTYIAHFLESSLQQTRAHVNRC